MPKLAELLDDPAKLSDVPRDCIPGLRGELAQLDTLLLSRLLAAKDQEPPDDQLLGIAETARRLGMSEDWLYRHHKDFSFTRRMGRKLLFSSKGIEKHLRSR